MSLEQAIIANTEAVNALLAAIKALPAEIAKQVSNISATGKTVKESKPEPKVDPVAEFIAGLDKVDWTFEMSDDPKVFKAGKAQVTATIARAKELGAEAIAAVEKWQAKASGNAVEQPATAGGNAAASNANASAGSGPSIALPDLLKLGNAIQAFKKVDTEKGPKAVEAFKSAVTKTGAARLSDPNLKPEQYPELHATLSAIVNDNDIWAALEKAGVKIA